MTKDVQFVTPNVQYGILNSTVTLQCTATFRSNTQYSHKWTYPQGFISMRGIIESVHFEDEGQYTCHIFFGAVFLDVTHFIQLVVLGEPCLMKVGSFLVVI